MPFCIIEQIIFGLHLSKSGGISLRQGQPLKWMECPLIVRNQIYNSSPGLDAQWCCFILQIYSHPKYRLNIAILTFNNNQSNQILMPNGLSKIFSYQKGRVGIPLTGLSPPHFCACPNPGPGYPTSYVVVSFVFRYDER